MDRRLYIVNAVVLLSLALAYAAFWPHTTTIIVLIELLVFGALCYFATGFRISISVGSWTLPWYSIYGIGTLALGGALPLLVMQMAGGGRLGPFYIVLLLILEIPMVVVGVKYLFGTHNTGIAAE
ncbi:hypothetical protein GL213_03690 [Halogeometricum borinquense]|uniref:Uncharacterized protein n=1 Tax=Halogeometricum borinquense TaxID=60847 RepID=A0A6C0UM46_9EURY|nr:hypothetical protein [Halogeometricum borinquense]QIB75441.1 hypothetical protein G3I44_14730 [Halogeometricum borinquense]QIQ75709.1 hypothetical protein GL213_03690 [Halogeometricum borinquense]